jgi:hypothetical protein
MATRTGCKLAIAVYPAFTYDASGGGGTAVASPASAPDPPLPPSVPPPPPGALALTFDPARVAIPALNWRTARFLGLPLPPGLEIAIRPVRLAGWVDRASGRVALGFDANFYFSAFGVYRPPPIPVETLLSTEAVAGVQLSGAGTRMDPATGSVRLAGVSRVPLNDAFVSWFLMLPADCLAEMDASFEFGQ